MDEDSSFSTSRRPIIFGLSDYSHSSIKQYLIKILNVHFSE